MTNSLVNIPVIADVDNIVVGATTGAVFAALAASKAGVTSFVVSDRSYFGEESAGRLDLWRKVESEDPLLKQVFAGVPIFPGAIKRGLEMLLVERGIPFLFLTRPVALLRSDDGGCVGLVLASRTSLVAVRAACVVDASANGVVARLAGVPLVAPQVPATEASLTVLADRDLSLWTGRSERVGSPWVFPDKKRPGREDRLQTYRLALETTPCGHEVADLAGREFRLRADVYDPAIALSADVLYGDGVVMAEACGLSKTPEDLDLSDVCCGKGLLVMGGILPLSAEGRARLERPETQAMVGGKCGQWAAELAAGARRGEVVPYAEQDARSFRFADSFVRQPLGHLTLSLPVQSRLGSCEVAVAGGGTGGAPAGISAARAGADTVVIEMQQGLGGVGTLGLVASYYFGNRVGFTRELDQDLARVESGMENAEPTQQWNPELKMAWYHRELLRAGGQAWLGSFAFGVRMDGDRVDGLLVSTPFGSGLLEVGSVVDATGNADIAAAAGAPCRVISGRHAAVQGAGLSSRRPGQHYRNSDHTFIDDCDVTGVTHAFVNARAKFADEFDTGTLVDTRERRQIMGEIELSPLDFLARRHFPDTINIARSNFDTHGFTVHPLFAVCPPDKKALEAHVPFRCLLPRGVEGVLVIGLGMSAHRDAIPVVRMQADVQNQGYAAGLAAVSAARGSRRLRDLDIRALQRELVALGGLDEEVLSHEDTFPLPDAELNQAVESAAENLFQTAVLFAVPSQAAPRLLEALTHEQDPERRERIALILGLLGAPEAAAILVPIVSSRPWDEGWNFRGMGQYGMSASRMDGLIVALSRTQDRKAVEPIIGKIRELGEEPDFSHCRAVALAAAWLREPSLTEALATLLNAPGMQGHAHLDIRQAVAEANDNPTETEARNRALRELYLARGLYLAGDSEGLGRRVLETYARDLRGPLARHAMGVLTEDGKDRDNWDVG